MIVLSASITALGNPIVPQDPPDSSFRIRSDTTGLLWMFILNLFVNFALFSLFMLITGSYRDYGIRYRYTSPINYMLAIAGVVCLITLIGAFVDFAFVMRTYHSHDGYFRYIDFNFVGWWIALALIFASVVLPTFAVLKVTGSRSSVVASLMCGANLLWWFASAYFGYDVAFLSILGSLLLTPVFLKILVQNYAYGDSAIELETLGGSREPDWIPSSSFGRKFNGPGQH